MLEHRTSTPANKIAPRTRRQRKQRVLDWINGVRAVEGLLPLDALPKGRRGSPNVCVLALTGDDWHAGSHSLRIRDRSGTLVVVQYPEYVEEFVFDFDIGNYPELIDENAERSNS